MIYYLRAMLFGVVSVAVALCFIAIDPKSFSDLTTIDQ